MFKLPIRRIGLAQLLTKIKRDKEAIIAISNRYHAVNVRVFGSVARGDDHQGSDVDLLVDFQPGTTLFDHVALQEELSIRLGRKVDVVSARALNKHLRSNILREAVEL
ncbi:MAG: nucleotidyltransferase family protein [Deltaproteobacteria bacterium]|nr:nucleotidyltransferase family protein [Deltaproteobacteria bacterium]